MLFSMSSLMSAKFALPRTSSASLVTGQSSMAHMATICWASTSSGLRRYRVDSIRPCCMRYETTAASTRSARCLGKILPRLTSPTLWPERPIRCRPRLTAPGDSTCTTRSIAPISMPSSNELVAISPFSSPRLS